MSSSHTDVPVPILTSRCCANCDKSYRACTLKRCSGCSLRYYCSQECLKAHRKVHKVECRQAQKARNASSEEVMLDLTHPFDRAIAAFEAQEFTEASFVRFIETVKPLYFIDQSAEEYRIDLEGVTESGYLHLIPLAIKALREYPDSALDVDYAAFDVFISYVSKYCTLSGDPSRVEVLFKANMLDYVMHSLKKYSANSTILHHTWFLFGKLANTQRSKYLDALGSVGILDLASEALKTNGRDFFTCGIVFETLAQWLQRAIIRGVVLPPYDTKALLVNILLSMKRFSENCIFLGNCCLTLRGLLDDFKVNSQEVNAPPLTAVMASVGVYELLIATIQRFPTSVEAVLEGSYVLRNIAKQYFADQSKLRNTEACVVLVVSLSHRIAERNAAATIIGALQIIIRNSQASCIKVLETVGLRAVAEALRTHMTDAELVRSCVATIYYACCICVRQIEVIDFVRVGQELERDTLPTLVQCFKLYLNCSIGITLYNILLCVMGITILSIGEYPEITELVREAMRLHPANEEIQKCGEGYLNSLERFCDQKSNHNDDRV